MQTVVNSVLTHYEDINPQQKSVVLFLPGWANTSQHWLPLARQLPTHHRYLLLDLPGFGQTQFLPEGANIPEYAKFVVAFIQKLKLKKVILFGHSFGGQISLYIALKHPSFVSRLILLSPAGIRLKTRYQKIHLRLVKLINKFKKVTPSPLYQFFLKQFASDDYINALGQHRQILNRIVNFDLSPQIHQIKVPVLLLWGDQDQVIPYQGKFMAENMPHCQLQVLYGIGHLPHLLQPDRFIKTLTEVIDNL